MQFNIREIFKIIWKSFEGAINWTGWKWFITGSIGALSGTLNFGKSFFELDLQKSITYGCLFLLSLFLLRFVLIFFKESLKYFHQVYINSIYGEAIKILNETFANLHHYRKTPGHQDTEFVRTLLLLCDNLRVIYEKILKSDCSVSIKVPLKDNSVDAKTILLNLARDTSHSSRDTTKYSEIKHTIIGNSAFTYALNQVINNRSDKHYINNNINNTKDYLNSSQACYLNGIFPYNSELVYPIVPIINDTKNNFDCLGFICIDTEKENAFKTSYEIEILKGIADGIYDIILERLQYSNQSIN